MTKQKLQIILMIILVILLGLFFFKEPIFKYLKRREITREVLGRVSMYNVPEIATACYYYLKDQETSESHIETYQKIAKI